MATGPDMFEALKRKTANLPAGSRFEVNDFDAKDLMKLTADDLLARGLGPAVTERAGRDLLEGGVAELGKAIGIELPIGQRAPNLIPGEGLKRALVI